MPLNHMDQHWGPSSQEFTFEGGYRAGGSPQRSPGPPVREDDLALRTKAEVDGLTKRVGAFSADVLTRLANLEAGNTGHTGCATEETEPPEDGKPCGWGRMTCPKPQLPEEHNPGEEKPMESPEVGADSFVPTPGMTVYEKITWKGPYVLVQDYDSPAKLEIAVNVPGQPKNHYYKVPLKDAWIVRESKTQNLVVKPLATLTNEKPPKSKLVLAVASLTPAQWALIFLLGLLAIMSGTALFRTF